MTDVSSPELLEVYTPALGRSVYLRPDTSDSQCWGDVFTGAYHRPALKWTPASVLDLGSNVGLTAADYCAMWPHAFVVGVEMDADCIRLAEKNAPEAVFTQCAVTGTDGFVRYDDSTEAHAYAVSDTGTVVPSVRLGTLIPRFFTGDVDFVKCDTEGSCWEMFADGENWQPWVKTMLVELHERNAPPPPSGPWPVGRDGPSPLLAAAVPLLEALGYHATPRLDHPASVWCVRR